MSQPETAQRIPLFAAKRLIAAGVSVIPILADGSKAPAVAWKPFQSCIATLEQLAPMFRGHVGIAIIAGRVSGNLEIIDVEHLASQAELCQLIDEHLPGGLKTLPQVNTPSGGRHIFYRCSEIAGNQKLAMSTENKVLIEIRGEGGYVLTVTSPPECHPTGKIYTLASGSLQAIPTITPEQREILLDCCRSFNQMAKPVERSAGVVYDRSRGKRPGDEFNERGDGLAVLLAHGWKVHGRNNGHAYLTRPGKDHGISASWGKVAPNTMYVFSSNAIPFEFERAYDAFGIVAHLDYGGDFEVAARALRQQGYGGQIESLPPPRPLESPEPPKQPFEPESNVKPFRHPKSVAVQLNPEDPEPFMMPASGGKPTGNLDNAVSILENHNLLKGLVWFDEFLGKLMTEAPAREWKDTDDLKLTLFMQRRCGVEKMSRDTASQAAILVAHRNVKNCVKDWLNSLTWDKERRISHCFEDCFGAKGTPYIRAASMNFWLSMVARVFQPGCKSDYMIVLEGKQGSRKSTALSIIGGAWYSEQLEAATGKAFFETIQGKMLVEISEFDSFNKADITRVKQIITCRSDRFRESYGRHAKDHARQCIFAATTNRDDWNRDETGARRFWPVRCNDEIDLDSLKANREQLFAEAVALFKAGSTWWEMPYGETSQEQDERYEIDAWTEPISEWIGLRDEVSVKEILADCLKFDLAKMSRADQMRVGAILRRFGWTSKNVRAAGGAVRKVWLRE